MMVVTILHLPVEVLIVSLITLNQVFTVTAAAELIDIEPKDESIKQELLWPSKTEEIKEEDNIEKQEEE